MKFKVTLHKEFEVDTDKHWTDHNALFEKLRENFDPGSVVDASDIKDAIEGMLEDDIGSVVDTDLDETDFQIEVSPSTTLKIPKEEEE